MRVVITRAEGRGDRLATQLRALGADPIQYPVIAYKPPKDDAPMREALMRLMDGAYDWLVATSATAVHTVETWLTDTEQRELPAHVRLAAVGPATAEACMNRLHRSPVAVPEVFTAQHLADAMEDAAPVRGLRSPRVLLLNADIAKPGLEVSLSEAGADVDRVIAYRTVPADSNDVDLRAMLVEGAVHAVTFTSGSTVRYFVERVGPDMLDTVRKLLIVCIGLATAEAAREIGLPPTAVAQVATEEGLVDALVVARNERCQVQELLGKASVVHAQAGADVIAPSGMLDGMVGAIRRALDAAHLEHVAIMSYAAKFTRSLYGPFREAAEGAPMFGDRAQYQMDFANAREAMKEVALDVAEGADMLMVKPAGAYLDIIQRVRDAYDLPLAAHQVSGEFSMIKAAAANGWIDECRAALETLIAIRRAGADMIITYFAKDVAQWLN